MKHYRGKPFSPPQLHDTVFDLIAAADSGNVIKVKKLLKNGAFPEGVIKASTQALGHIEPLDNPDISVDLWWNHNEPHKADEQRPSKRKLRGAWRQISRCIHILLDAGADPDASGPHAITPINNFNSQELTDVFNRLLQLGANPNSNYYGGNPLCNAVILSGCADLHVQLLLDYGADPNNSDDEGNTPLILASNYGSLETVQKLINTGADVNHRNNKGETPLMAASFGPSVNILQELINAAADVNHKSDKGETPLMRASASQSWSVMQTLIDAGADINCRDNMGRTALMNALNRHVDIPLMLTYEWLRDCHIKASHRELSLSATNLLISSGADFDKADNNGYLPTDYALMAHLNGVDLPKELKVEPLHLRLCRAAIHNNISELTSLLASECIPQRVMTLALHLAATRGYAECCAVLLAHGADINGFDLSGNHPIESASVGLHLHVVQLMIEHAATLEGLSRALLSACTTQSHYWPNEDRRSFLDRRLELARYLLEHGANPDYRNEHSDPPLKQAIGNYEDYDLAILLLEYGANPTETDEEGETLLEFARTDRMKAILQEWISKSCHPK